MQTYESNPNQRYINILEKGHEICDTEHFYLKQQKAAMFEAMKALTPTTFEVWLYLASQKKDYCFALSPAVVTKETGIKKSSIQEGIRVLIREKYLIPKHDGSNVYEFYELPRIEEEEDIIEIHTNNIYDNEFHF